MADVLTSTYHAIGSYGAMYGTISYKYTAYDDYYRVYIYWLGEGLKTTESDAASTYSISTSATIKGEVLIGSSSKASWTSTASGTRSGYATYSSYVWFKAGGSDANYVDIARTTSAQTVTIKVTYTVSGYSAITGSTTFTVAAKAVPTMTVHYHANGGWIPDSPHQHTSSSYWICFNERVYSSTSATGTFSQCNYAFTTATTYPNHWNVETMGLIKTGYHIIGTEAWNTEADGTGVKINQDYSSSSTVNPATTQATNGGSQITEDTSVRLYADWKPNTYTITYNGNGNTYGSTADSTHTYDSPKALTLNGYGKEGYLFKGWATSEARANAGIVDFKDNQNVCSLTAINGGTVTLYAVWGSPPTFGRIEDDWYGSNKMYVNINGVWQPVIDAFAREDNTWKEI